jgi:segregation and condensation protein B
MARIGNLPPVREWTSSLLHHSSLWVELDTNQFMLINDKRALGPLARRSPDQLPTNTPLSPALGWLGESGTEASTSDPLGRDRQLAELEAILLAADEPLAARRLAQVAGLVDAALARRLIRKLETLYDRDGTAFQIEELAGGFQLLTRPQYHRWLASLRRSPNELRLTGAARETLAIVAYRQPIMRADVEDIRGVQCGETLRLLMEKGLVRICGREPSLGRPVLYGTTKKFLHVFGLRGLKDLPRAEEFKNMTR